MDGELWGAVEQTADADRCVGGFLFHEVARLGLHSPLAGRRAAMQSANHYWLVSVPADGDTVRNAMRRFDETAHSKGRRLAGEGHAIAPAASAPVPPCRARALALAPRAR